MGNVSLYNPNDRLTGRDGGPYLDEVEMHLAETRRAAIENREPDYDNLQPTAGVPLVTAAQLVAAGQSAGLPSQENNTAYSQMVDNHAESELGAPVRGTLNVADPEPEPVADEETPVQVETDPSVPDFDGE